MKIWHNKKVQTDEIFAWFPGALESVSFYVRRCFPLCQKVWQWSKVKWKVSFRFGPTAVFARWSTSRTEIFRSILTNQFSSSVEFHLCGDWGNEWKMRRAIPFRPRLYGEKLSRVEVSPAYPSYPGRANFSYISLQNLANRLYEKQNVGSARRVTRLAG